MMRFLLIAGLVGIALNVTSHAEDQVPPPKSSAKHPALEQIKKWAGEWVEQDANGKPTDKIVSVFKVTAAGNDLSPRWEGSPVDPLLCSWKSTATETRFQKYRERIEVQLCWGNESRSEKRYAYA
jgi:hypothetical protein